MLDHRINNLRYFYSILFLSLQKALKTGWPWRWPKPTFDQKFQGSHWSAKRVLFSHKENKPRTTRRSDLLDQALDPQSVDHCLASREDWITKRAVKMKYLLCLSLLLFIHQILAIPVAPQEEDQLPRAGRTFSGNSTEDIFNDLSRLLQAWILILSR